MPLILIQDVPEELYKKLAFLAESEHRSISQQAIVLLERALDLQDERMSRRKALLQRIEEADLGQGKTLTDPAILIREDRER